MRTVLRLLPILFLALVLAACTTVDTRSDSGRRGNARASQQNERVTVCHKGKRTMRLRPSAVRAHLDHGDRRGRCRR